MELHNANQAYDPWEERKELLRRFKEILEALHATSMTLNFGLDFNKASADGRKSGNDLEPTVFLSKTITDIAFFNDNGVALPKGAKTENIKSVEAIFYGHVKVRYEAPNPQTKTRDRIIASNIVLDYKAPHKKIAEQAVLELVNATFASVQMARALGWTKIKISEDADPLQRYIAKALCGELGVYCDVGNLTIEDLPKTAAFPEGLREYTNTMLDANLTSILYKGIVQEEQKKPDNDNKGVADAFDSLGLDLTA
jgi:hypothetical protein